MADRPFDVFSAFQLAGLMVFLATIVGKTVHQITRKKINPITLDVGKKGLLGIMELFLFVEVNVWVLSVLWAALPLDLPPIPGPLGAVLVDALAVRLAGLGLVTIAFVLFVLALVSLGDAWRLGLDEAGPGRLVTHGIYSVSRNPIYLFFDLYFIGTFLINGGLLFLLLAVLTVLNLHYQILHEERFLARLHGSAYEAYRARTARYVGWHVSAPATRRLRQPANPGRRASEASDLEESP
jgi:protein-S-isoprenylcysteine O-methyltransferase Ste14